MAQGRKGKLNYRCPACFMREIDMDMLYDKDNEEYYCLRCSFVGSESEVLMLNRRTRYRFKDRGRRITDFSSPRKGRLTKVLIGQSKSPRIPIKEQEPIHLKLIAEKNVLQKNVQATQ